MSQIPEKEKLFEFKWASPPKSFTNTHLQTHAFNFGTKFTNTQTPLANTNATNQNRPIKDDSKPFKFSFNFKEETKMSDDQARNKQNRNQLQTMVFAPPKPSQPKPKRRIKMPDFGLLKTHQQKLLDLQTKITEHEAILILLKREQSEINHDTKQIASDITNWYRNWKLWDEVDFMHWVFEEIDNGYFKLKRNMNNDTKPFDIKQCTQQLNMMVHAQRFALNGSSKVFEGSHLKYFDILDVRQLFGFLNIDDCRKLFTEIEKLTKSERCKNQINQNCEICMVNKKQYVLGCGHVFCVQCVAKLKVCAFCKKRIDKNKIIKVFL